MTQKGWVEIDGSKGEGGGQIVRTALALSCLTGKPVRLYNVRAKRKNPGLGKQHVTAVEAVQKICGAETSGVEVGSSEFTFRPGTVTPGDYQFDIGTAGSVTLVFQTVVWPLVFTDGDSTVVITGGTHNPMAPCYDYLELVWIPLAKQLGVEVQARLMRAGFYPQGGGKVRFRIRGLGSRGSLQPMECVQRGTKVQVWLRSYAARLPIAIAQRQADRARRRIEKKGFKIDRAEVDLLEALSPGSVIFVRYSDEKTIAGFDALGERGKPAERVADEAVDRFFEYADRAGALDPHAADQIVLPLALARGPSRYTTTRVTEHLLTHVDLIRQFLPREIDVTGQVGSEGTVVIR